MESNRFEKRLEYVPSEVWSKIIQIDQLKEQWIHGAQLNSNTLERLKCSVLIVSSDSSARIEGSRISDEDIKNLLKKNIQKFTNRDEQEAIGYLKLLENIFNDWKNLKFSEDSIKNFHKELLKYRYSEKLIPICLISKEMQKLILWTQKNIYENKYHPLLLIANFIVEFLNIHKLTNNNYLSRILTNLLLLQSGYLYVPYISYEKLIEENKPNYYMALRKSQKTFNKKGENIVPWLNFFLTIFLKQSKMAIELLSKENIEKNLSIKQLAVWQYIQITKESSPIEISKNVDIARPTVSQALSKLLKLRKIERIGSGRSTRYRIF